MKASSTDFLPLARNLLEKLYDDESQKDVELVASDGIVRAHSCVLSAITEPLKSMLSNGMMESETKRIQMADFNVVQLKFIMRLLCTGGMDSSEWHYPSSFGELDSSSPSGEVGSPETSFLTFNVRVVGRPDLRREYKMKPTTRYGKLMEAFVRGSRPSGHELKLENIHCFSADGRTLKPDDTPARTGLMDDDIFVKITTAQNQDEDESLDHVDLHPPLDLLFAAASFAKLYGIEDFLATVIERLKASINIKHFDEVMRFAIKLDMAPIRMAGLLFARDSQKLKDLFDQKKFSPQVQFELQAIWPAVPAKKRRLSPAVLLASPSAANGGSAKMTW